MLSPLVMLLKNEDSTMSAMMRVIKSPNQSIRLVHQSNHLCCQKLHLSNLLHVTPKIFGTFVLDMLPQPRFESILTSSQVTTPLAVSSAFEPNRPGNHFIPQKAKLLENSNVYTLIYAAPFQHQKENPFTLSPFSMN